MSKDKINMIPQLCPNCCVELIKDVKQLGQYRNWLVCPKCGHRERPNNESVSSELTRYSIDRIKQRNKNWNQFNKED